VCSFPLQYDIRYDKNNIHIAVVKIQSISITCKMPLVVPLWTLPLPACPQPLPIPGSLFYTSGTLSFQSYHLKKIIQHENFCDGFCTQHHFLQSCVLSPVSTVTSFCCLGELVWMNQFNCSPIEGHLICFQFCFCCYYYE
jgi:hypothetical protein